MEQLSFDFYSHVKELKKIIQEHFDSGKKHKNAKVKEAIMMYRELHSDYFIPIKNSNNKNTKLDKAMSPNKNIYNEH